jgi:valyl-tRNA synthetase
MQIGNEAFMAKPPAPIVDGLGKQHAETKMLYDKIKAALDALGLWFNRTFTRPPQS